MRHLKNKKVLSTAIALLVAVGVINSVGVILISNTKLKAQVFDSFLFFKPTTVIFGVEDNNDGSVNGLSFKSNKFVTIKACAGGGGGGGGGRGWEDGSSDGNGGGGGGGGGKGTCQIKKSKMKAGDTIRWHIGSGGTGGAAGEINVITTMNMIITDTVAQSGGNGGWTYVSINGVDIMQLPGGNGGLAGTNAYTLQGTGGLGGSLVSQNMTWHKGIDGHSQWENPQIHMGNGGRGGRGENNIDGSAMNGGLPGVSSGSYPFGGNGSAGENSFGGGGGGGGAGKWYDYDYDGGNWDDAIRNSGGSGGVGGNGYVEISW